MDRTHGPQGAPPDLSGWEAALEEAGWEREASGAGGGCGPSRDADLARVGMLVLRKDRFQVL